jgi:hypothetical protein
MITPAKHMNLNLSVIRLSAILLKYLRRHRVVTINAALDHLLRKAGKDTTLVFPHVLSFLYLLGRIDYHPQEDSLEYIEWHGAN